MVNACVFVDGENFRYSLVKVCGDDFDKAEYLPKDARWAEFFDWLVLEACGAGARRLRTYWYVQQHVDFYPYRLPNPGTGKGSLEVLLRKHDPFKKQLDRAEGDNLLAVMGGMVRDLKQTEQNFRSRFNGWQVIQDGIAGRHRAVEFRRAGAIRYNLFRKQMGQEKAVDVMLATDLIMLREIYDVAILVSGDQDYVPAVQVVKDAGKTVVNVAFQGRKGKLLPGGARRLNLLTDSSIAVPQDTLKKFLGIPGPVLPFATDAKAVK